MRFYLMTGDYTALDSLADSRVKPFLSQPGFAGTELLVERVSWAATARLALGDSLGARQLLEAGIPAPDRLDPHPAKVRTLALLARARSKQGDLEGAAEAAASASQLLQRAVDQGWGSNQMEYALATVAASTGALDEAMEHLKKAREAGWSNFAFANHDPLMVDVIQSPESAD